MSTIKSCYKNFQDKVFDKSEKFEMIEKLVSVSEINFYLELVSFINNHMMS